MTVVDGSIHEDISPAGDLESSLQSNVTRPHISMSTGKGWKRRMTPIPEISAIYLITSAASGRFSYQNCVAPALRVAPIAERR